MSDLNPREESILLSLLDQPSTEGAERFEQSEDRETHREYLELLGMLPGELEPVQPRPEVKQRLMAAVLESLDEAPDAAVTSAAESAVETPVVEVDRFVEARERASRSAFGRSPWVTALAASLVLALAGVSGWLYGRVQQSDARIVEISESLDVAQRSLNELRQELAQVSDRFELVTTAEACPMRPRTAEAGQPDATGILFMDAQTGGSYLRVRGVDMPDSGAVYQLWFLTADGPINGGVLRPMEDGSLELVPSKMPMGTRGVMVTLEPEPVKEAPTGSEVLYGDDRVALL